MTRLGYEEFLAHGGDWGEVVTTVLGAQHANHCMAIHTTFAQIPPGLPDDDLDAAERAEVERTRTFWRERSAYARQQATRPQTIGYALVDSPVGLLAWILDKFAEWTDTEDSPFETVSRDRLLDDVTLYRLTRSGASAAHQPHVSTPRATAGSTPRWSSIVPTAVTVYPYDIERFPPCGWSAATAPCCDGALRPPADTSRHSNNPVSSSTNCAPRSCRSAKRCARRNLDLGGGPPRTAPPTSIVLIGAESPSRRFPARPPV